jgi:hypothetical protein
MRPIDKIGLDPLNGRDLYFLELQRSEELPSDIKLSSTHFVCLIAWDSEESSDAEISALIQALLRAGCCYICAWGSGSEHVYEIIAAILNPPSEDKGVPLTSEKASILFTSFEHRELEQALFYFVELTSPDEPYKSTCNCSLAISIGFKEWSNHIRQALDGQCKYSLSHELDKRLSNKPREVDIREINQKYSLLKITVLINISLWVAGFSLLVLGVGQSIGIAIFSVMPIAYIAFLYSLGCLAELLGMRALLWVVFAAVFWLVGGLITFLIMRSKVMDAREFAVLRRMSP